MVRLTLPVPDSLLNVIPRSRPMTEPTLDLPAPAHEATAATEAAAAAAPTTAGTLVLEAPKPVDPVPATTAEGAVPISTAEQDKLDSMVAGYLDAVSTLDTHSQAFTDKVKDIVNARRRRHPGLGGRVEPAAGQAARRDAERRPDRDARRSASRCSTSAAQVEDLDPSQPGRPVRPAQAARASCRSVPATRSATTSTSTAPARPTSTRSSRPCTTARTSCSATTPRSSRRRSTCGRSWAGCASTSTWPSSSTTR